MFKMDKQKIVDGLSLVVGFIFGILFLEIFTLITGVSP